MAADPEVPELTDSHFRNWARMLAAEYGGEVSPFSEDSVCLNSSSNRWEQVLGSKDRILLSENPNDPDSWRVRLQHVEKRIAQAIISTPLAFGCSVKEGKRVGNSRGLGEVIRFAFGLSLSLGVSSPRRYTAYYVSDSKAALCIAGKDKLFESCENFVSANLRSKQVIKGLQQILDLIPRVKREYEDSQPVQLQISILNKAIINELRDLDRLYLSGHGQYAQLLGTPSESVKGDDALELEYFNRLKDVVEKFRICVRLTPLTLSVVRCQVQMKKGKKADEVTIPFVDQPIVLTSN